MTKAIPSETRENPLEEQAASWFLRIQEGDCSAVEQREFEAWLAASPDHRREYQQYVRLWSDLDRVGSPAKAARGGKMRGGLALLALAATLVAAQWLAGREETFVTAVGERRHIVLADGTAVDMNTATELKVGMSGLTRRITLEKGEALFDVAHSALRPFEVRAGGATLRDIGTSFNVIRDDDTTTVAVLQGEVQVRLDSQSVSLRGGEQVAYSARGLSPVSRVDTATTAWRTGRLVFRETSLEEVVRQINRYHARQVVLADTRLGSLKVSGEFNAADRDGLIRSLKMLFPVRSEERGETTALLPHPGRS